MLVLCEHEERFRVVGPLWKSAVVAQTPLSAWKTGKAWVTMCLQVLPAHVWILAVFDDSLSLTRICVCSTDTHQVHP